MNISKITTTLLIALFCTTAVVEAQQSIYRWGYGVKAIGMGGVSMALPQDSQIAATNPAGMVFVGNRWDLDILGGYNDVVGKIEGNAYPTNNAKCHDHTFWGPYIDGGFNMMLSDNLSVGFSMYGTGGKVSNTHNQSTIYGTSRRYVEYGAFFFTPTLAWRFCGCHAIGFGPTASFALLKLKGFQSFEGSSIHPHHVTGKNYNYKPGLGYTVGYMGKFFDCFSVGVSYHSKQWQKKFNKYKGYLPGQGNNDIPAYAAAGIAFHPSCRSVVGFDVFRHFNTQSRLFGNRLTIDHEAGSNKGTGFGWKDTWDFKVGGAFDINDCFTVRTGFNYCLQQVPRSQTLSNLPAGLVVNHHFTVGATWHFNACIDLEFAFVDGWSTVKGRHSIPEAYGGGEASVRNTEPVLYLGIGVKL